MSAYPIYFTPTRPIPPPFSHPRPEYPYYGYRPGTVPPPIYQQQVSAPVPNFFPRVSVFVQPVVGYPVWQASSPTPLPVPAGTPSDVRYENIGGVLTPVRHFYSNSPVGATRGWNTLYGFDTGSLPPGRGITPPAVPAPPAAPAVRDTAPAPASPQPDAQPDAGTARNVSPGTADTNTPSPDILSSSSTDETAPTSEASSDNAPPRPPRPTVEDAPEPDKIDHGLGTSSGDLQNQEGQGAPGSGATNEA